MHVCTTTLHAYMLTYLHACLPDNFKCIHIIYASQALLVYLFEIHSVLTIQLAIDV